MLKSKKAIIKNLIVTSLLAISTIVIFSLGIKFLVNSSNKQRNIENTKNYQVEHEHCIKNIDVLYSQGFYTKDEYKSIKDENGFFRFYCKQNERIVLLLPAGKRHPWHTLLCKRGRQDLVSDETLKKSADWCFVKLYSF